MPRCRRASRAVRRCSACDKPESPTGRGTRDMKWVLNTYQTAQDWDVDRIVQICQAAGYVGAELLQDFNQKHGVEASATDAHVLDVKEKVQAAGLIVSSLTSCCHFHAPEETERHRNIDQVKRVIDQAALMVCDHV